MCAIEYFSNHYLQEVDTKDYMIYIILNMSVSEHHPPTDKVLSQIYPLLINSLNRGGEEECS